MTICRIKTRQLSLCDNAVRNVVAGRQLSAESLATRGFIHHKSRVCNSISIIVMLVTHRSTRAAAAAAAMFSTRQEIVVTAVDLLSNIAECMTSKRDLLLETE